MQQLYPWHHARDIIRDLSVVSSLVMNEREHLMKFSLIRKKSVDQQILLVWCESFEYASIFDIL